MLRAALKHCLLLIRAEGRSGTLSCVHLRAADCLEIWRSFRRGIIEQNGRIVWDLQRPPGPPALPCGTQRGSSRAPLTRLCAGSSAASPTQSLSVSIRAFLSLHFVASFITAPSRASISHFLILYGSVVKKRDDTATECRLPENASTALPRPRIGPGSAPAPHPAPPLRPPIAQRSRLPRPPSAARNSAGPPLASPPAPLAPPRAAAAEGGAERRRRRRAQRPNPERSGAEGERGRRRAARGRAGAAPGVPLRRDGGGAAARGWDGAERGESGPRGGPRPRRCHSGAPGAARPSSRRAAVRSALGAAGPAPDIHLESGAAAERPCRGGG